MKKIFGFTERYLNFWLDLSKPTREENIERFCRVEFGRDWQWAYSEMMKTNQIPSYKKVA